LYGKKRGGNFLECKGKRGDARGGKTGNLGSFEEKRKKKEWLEQLL